MRECASESAVGSTAEAAGHHARPTDGALHSRWVGSIPVKFSPSVIGAA